MIIYQVLSIFDIEHEGNYRDIIFASACPEKAVSFALGAISTKLLNHKEGFVNFQSYEHFSRHIVTLFNKRLSFCFQDLIIQEVALDTALPKKTPVFWTITEEVIFNQFCKDIDLYFSQSNIPTLSLEEKHDSFSYFTQNFDKFSVMTAEEILILTKEHQTHALLYDLYEA